MPEINQSDFEKNKAAEEIDALFFDDDADADVDLYVVTGAYNQAKNEPLLKDLYYRNDGKGHFIQDKEALPDL